MCPFEMLGRSVTDTIVEKGHKHQTNHFLNGIKVTKNRDNHRFKLPNENLPSFQKIMDLQEKLLTPIILLQNTIREERICTNIFV